MLKAIDMKKLLTNLTAAMLTTMQKNEHASLQTLNNN